MTDFPAGARDRSRRENLGRHHPADFAGRTGFRAGKRCARFNRGFPYDVAPWPIDSTIVQPEYPRYGMIAGVQCKVKTELYITADGYVESVTSKSNQGPGARTLGFEAVVDSVVQLWHFLPAQCSGKPCSSVIQITFAFFLKSGHCSDSTWIMDSVGDVNKMNQERASNPRFIYQPLPVFHCQPAVKREIYH